MSLKTVTANKSANSRQNVSGGGKQGRSNDRLVVGRVLVGGTQRIYRAFIDFDFPGDFWSDVERVRKAELVLTVAADGDSTVITGDTARIRVRRNTRNFKSASSSWTSDGYVGLFVNTNPGQTENAAVGSGAPQTAVTVDITNIVRQWAPKKVKFPSGTGAALARHGVAVTASDEGQSRNGCEFYSQDAGASVWRPKLDVTYDAVNAPPSVQMAEPDGSVTSDFQFTGNFTGPEPDDFLTKVRVETRRKSNQNAIWSTTVSGISLDPVDGLWHIDGPAVGTYRKDVDYEARARVWDRHDDPSDWTGWKTFRVVSDEPVTTVVPIGVVDTLDNVRFAGACVIDTKAGAMVRVDIQLQERGGDWSAPAWNTSYPPTLEERTSNSPSAFYRGRSLGAGDYEWRMRVADALGGLSEWSVDDTLTLLVGQPMDEGEQAYTSAWKRVQVGQRILIRELRNTDRGPGRVLAVIENAGNIGSSWYATAPGELYFTLPNSHPQVSVIEPLASHYQFQQYVSGRWKTLGEGLVRDFDATDEETVFYGLDYLGLLSWSIERAKQPDASPRKNIGTKVDDIKGSRYYNRTIRYIIKDQLKRARLQDEHSPVRFIQTGRVDPFDTKVTIYASYAERLGFIRGLIDSHRGAVREDGGERRSRLRVRFNPAANEGQGRHEFEALDDVGQDRENLRLEYGSTVQGYQVIALDEFASRIYAIGKEPNALRPYFRTADAPGIDTSKWGHFGRPAFYEDIVDKKDLYRRAKALAIRTSRVGKRIALGLRVQGLKPFDGWDLLDAFPILIRDGIVDTTRYGSGYWVVWGVEYRVYPDGHDELTLIVRPRGDRAEIDPDLIPSDPIHFETDWTWGDGPPPEE